MSRRAGRAIVALMVAAALAAAVVTVGAPAAAPSSRSGNRPRLSEHRILRIAKTAAVRAGDPKPTLIQHSEGTRHTANLVASGDGVSGRAWSYLIAERGHFVLKDAQTPPGAPAPRGSVLTLVVNASTGQTTDGGVSNRYPDLDRLGPVHTDLRRSAAKPSGARADAATSARHRALAYRTFRKYGVRLRYPAAWRAYTYPNDASSFTRLIVYLSNVRLHDPCVTHKTPQAVTTRCGQPVDQLAPGSILVSWSANGIPGWNFAKASGTPIRVDGHRAKLQRRHATCQIHADVELDVTVKRRRADNWYLARACIRGPGTARLAGQFKQLLKAARVSP